MSDYRQILARMTPDDPAREAIVHCIFGRSADLKMDEPGRIKLPELLLSYAGIKKKVVFSGAFDKFRIWNPEEFAAFDAEMVAKTRVSRGEIDAPFREALAAGAISNATGSPGEGEL